MRYGFVFIIRHRIILITDRQICFAHLLQPTSVKDNNPVRPKGEVSEQILFYAKYMSISYCCKRIAKMCHDNSSHVCQSDFDSLPGMIKIILDAKKGLLCVDFC